MEYTKYKTYWYKYTKEGKEYKVSNFFVADITYEMVYLSFDKALKYNKSELINE
jgi:hypothetical protein